MNVNHQMTEVYGMNTERCCKECKHFDLQTKVCSVARAVGFGGWIKEVRMMELIDKAMLYRQIAEKEELVRDRVIDTPANSPLYMHYVTQLNERTRFKCMVFDTPAVEAVPQWISVEDRLPEPETEVLVLCVCCGIPIITNGLYEDGNVTKDESDWNWYDLDFDYDEENDAYLIPEGWWEYKHFNQDDEYNHPIDIPVTHWIPLPELPNGGEEKKCD